MCVVSVECVCVAWVECMGVVWVCVCEYGCSRGLCVCVSMGGVYGCSMGVVGVCVCVCVWV